MDEPPGRIVAEQVARALRASGVSITRPVTVHDSYGWAFEVELTGVRIWLMVQRSDQWLLITQTRRSLVDRLLRRTYETAHRAVADTLDQALHGPLGATDVKWYTRAQFESQASGPTR